MKDKIVCIEWLDATYTSNYYDKEHPEKFDAILTRTVGHLVRKTKKDIIVSQDRFYEAGKPSDDRHLSTIPKKMVDRIIELNDK